MPDTTEELAHEGQNALVKHLIALEARVAHLEQSIHPDKIAHEVVHKIATHLHHATLGEHTPAVHEHKVQ
jgi:hypothetical protein